MSDLPVQGLLQQLGAHPVAGEHLEVLGKHASERWHAGKSGSLTESVVETVKHAGLSPEQVRRVVEFANTHAYLTEFQKEGAPHKVIDFGAGGPADISVILQDLNDGGGGSLHDRGTLDYDHPPYETKVSSVRGEIELGELFTSAPPLPYENPYGEAIEFKDKLAAASDHLLAEMSGLEVMYADLADRLYHQVKQAALSGTSLSDVCQAWQEVSPSDEHIKVAFQLFSPRLLREGVFRSPAAMLDSMDKTASAGLVNLEHPLLVDFADFCDTLDKLAETRAVREEVRENLDHAIAFLKAAASGGAVGAVTGATRRAGAAVSQHGGKALSKIVGDKAGTIVGGVAGKTIQFTPHVAALVAANEGRRHLQYGPVGSRVSNAVLSQVPMTSQYQQRNYNIQSGQS